MKLNENPSQLKVGDEVTTFFHYRESGVVRKITKIRADKSYDSGFVASADKGESCPTCGRHSGTSVGPVDASWFLPVVEQKDKKSSQKDVAD